jgi:tetratricopeptide (TPR) repeat protein
MNDPDAVPIPEAVTRLWKCVKKALAANEDPQPRRIERMAAAADVELAASTIEGWFKTWSVVPTWEKFDALIKALAADHDEDWRSLYRAALTADRERKREERQRKKRRGATAPVSSDPVTTDQPPVGLVDGSRSVPRQLPAAVAHFTGRSAELAKLDALLDQDDAIRPATMVVSAIAGAAGVGKTALVVHWAHRVRDHFPDGQLFVNLRGYDPGPPITPEQALEEFLRARHVPAERIPAALEARAALYRSLLDGRRVLIVLDNANSAEQVRPLLPGSPTCRAVVTSRSRLSGLIARDGVSRIILDLLSPAEALALLGDIIGATRVAAEPEATAQLACRCAYLPLALRIAAERAVAYPHVPLVDLAGELAVERDRLDLLAAVDKEDEATAVRAVFSWSYHALAPETARAFRLLGLHAGPDISAPAAAALINTTSTQARRLLETLVDTHLIEETGRDRYRFHDLLRVYATECAKAEETEHDRDAAVRRELTWYLHTGDAADHFLNPHRRRFLRIPLDDPEVACSPLGFTTYDQALDWCETERANLVAATRQAAEIHEYDIAWKLPLALWGFFELRKHWADQITTHRIGLTAAQHLHDRRAEAWTWGSLGTVYFYLHQHKEAFDHYQNALPICRETDDQWCEAIALLGLSAAYFYLGRYEESFNHSKRALHICQEIDDPWGQSFALINIGGVHRKRQQFEDALHFFQRVLDVVRPVHDKSGEAQALRNLGATYRDLQRFEDALEHFQKARTTYREISDRWGEALTLRNIGDILQNLNHGEAAAGYWHQALSIFEDLGDLVTAAKVRASLETVNTNNADRPS